MLKLLIILILLNSPTWSQSSFDEWINVISKTKEWRKLSLKNLLDSSFLTNDAGESIVIYKEEVFGGNFIFRHDKVQLVDVLNVYDNGTLRSTLENVYFIEFPKEDSNMFGDIAIAIIVDPSILVKDIVNFVAENEDGALLKIEIIFIKGQYTTYISDTTSDLRNSLQILE